MIQARFDTNEFGQYLGTATVIYSKASAATKAIADYNGASLDNRVMRVYFAEEPKPVQAKTGPQTGRDRRAQAKLQERRDRINKVRRTGGAISKNRDSRDNRGKREGRQNNAGTKRLGGNPRREDARRRFRGRRRNRGDQGRKQ